MVGRTTAFALTTLMVATHAISATFEHMNLRQEMDVDQLEVVGQALSQPTSGVTLISCGKVKGEIPQANLDGVEGMVFELREGGVVNFVMEDDGLQENPPSAAERILIGDKSLKVLVDEAVDALASQYSAQAITNQVLDLVYNPLLNKKLAVVGGTIASTPTIGTSWPAFIAQRNHMSIFHNGKVGERICEDVTNELGEVTIPSALNSCTNGIPLDVDYILCQVGSADDSLWEQGVLDNVADTNLATTTFKGAFNNLVIKLRKGFPGAKFGVVLPSKWPEDNVGYKSEDTLPTGTRRDMTQWMKTQCHKLNIPVFDPVEDSRMLTSNYQLTSPAPAELGWYDQMKQEMGTAQLEEDGGNLVSQSQYLRDLERMTQKGSMYLSFWVEDWLKTVMQAN